VCVPIAVPLQNQSNTLTLPVQCTVHLDSCRQVDVRITGVLRFDTLHAVSLSLRVAGGGPGVRVLLMVSIILCVPPVGFILFSHLQLQFKILELVTSASVELASASPLFLHEDRPLRHVSQQQTQRQQQPPPPPPPPPSLGCTSA